MANHKAAQKSIKQDIGRTERNNSRRNRIRTFIRKLDEAIIAGKKEELTNLFRQAQAEIAKGVTKGVLKLNTASRKIKRLAAKVKKTA
jgi:small subunit ribosomal protein S20